jgi:hypothetical protein
MIDNGDLTITVNMSNGTTDLTATEKFKVSKSIDPIVPDE